MARIVQWLCTAPDPRGLRHAHRAHDEDEGRRGWKLHAIMADDAETGDDIKRRRSACGLVPHYGWTVDLFLEERCKICLNTYRSMAAREKS